MIEGRAEPAPLSAGGTDSGRHVGRLIVLSSHGCPALIRRSRRRRCDAEGAEGDLDTAFQRALGPVTVPQLTVAGG